MAQNFNNYHSTPHGSPPPNNDFGGLMGSLISPGPGTPLQSAFPLQWPGQAGWQQNGGQSSYAYSMPNQIAWRQNVPQAYMPQDDEDEDMYAVDDTDILVSNGQPSKLNGEISGNLNGLHNHQHVRPGQIPSLSSSSPLTLPQPPLQDLTAGGPPQVTKTPMASSAATTTRAAELRAKLLANKSSNAASRQGSPASKANEFSEAKKSNVQDMLKKTNGILASHFEAQAPGETPEQAHGDTETHGEFTVLAPEPSPGKTVTNMDFDLLFAEAKTAADAHQSGVGMSNGNHENETRDMKSTPPQNIRPTEAAICSTHSGLKKSLSSSELSEPGEIHSGISSPNVAKQPTRKTDKEEAREAKEDKKEKLIPQTEVNNAYQPLRVSKSPAPEPTSDACGNSTIGDASSRSTIKANHKVSDDSRTATSFSRKSVVTQPHQQLGRSDSGKNEGEYESHPVHEETRRDQYQKRERDYDRREEGGVRRTSLAQQYPRDADLRRDVDARRQKHMDDNARRTEDNAKRAAEYKNGIEAQKVPFRQMPRENSRPKEEPQKQDTGARSAQSSTMNASGKGSRSSTTNNIPNDDSGDDDRDPDTLITSLTPYSVEGNQDINDWLEMTNYHDEEYREKRLGIFRRKRALEMQAAELEREEQELQAIPYVRRAQSIVPAISPPKVARSSSIVNPKMPPPPLPLKEANNDVGMKIKDSALSSGLPTSQKTTQTLLKRQHGEDDVETRRMQPADKLARIDMNGHAANDKAQTSPVSAKGPAMSVNIEPMPLENRISREDNDRFAARQRGRSRSPEYRRRSMSPRRRRFSDDYTPEPRLPFHRNYGGIARDTGTCHNCGKEGHYQHQCTESKRDGKEWNRPTAAYQQWVSPNYRGRNPVAREDVRPAGDNRPRFSSLKLEDGEMSIPRDNIGSRHLNLEAGDTRYFMIKSWNSENVEIALRDCTWATQEKNLPLLASAYATSRNVLLFFSINNSRAFQGYARMSSALDPTIPPPVWTKNLLWTPSPAFKITWITRAHCRFGRIGHLKNSLNENQAVLVGRDGQEIEGECGRRLAGEIDEVGGVGTGREARYERTGGEEGGWGQW